VVLYLASAPKCAFCCSSFSHFKIVYLVDSSEITAVSQVTVASHDAVCSLHYCTSF